MAELRIHLQNQPLVYVDTDEKVYALILDIAQWFEGLGGAWLGVPGQADTGRPGDTRDVWVPASTEMLAIWDGQSPFGRSPSGQPELAAVLPIQTEA